MKPHCLKIRKVKTSSGNTALQVGIYKGKRFKVIKHIGSAKTKEKIQELFQIAQEFITSHSPQLSLNFNPQSEEILFKRGIRIKEGSLQVAYDYLNKIYSLLGFSKLKNLVLKNFVFMRVLEPASKTKSIKLLGKYFNIFYKRTTVFRELSKLSVYKEQVEQLAINYAKLYLDFTFSLVFYDVTTLYFETNKEDDFRRNGFSKDNKINHPQILVGLLVNEMGFPVFYDLFEGNTFEGKTFLPVILKIKRKYQIDKFTVVADAGMLSEKNISELEKEDINYVVGARIRTLSLPAVLEIAQKLNKEDGKIIREDSMLYDYSLKRAAKDKVDNDKGIQKAIFYLHNSSKVFKRTKFLKNTKENKFKINNALIEKHRALEGIKGYKTNLEKVDEKVIISRYRDLWRIEQSFRIAKSDLEARPIFHRKRLSIEAHLLIVFMALCMSKVIEKEKGGSIRNVVEDLKDKWQIILIDEISGNTATLLFDKKPH